MTLSRLADALDPRALNILISAAINATLGITYLLSDPRRFSSATFTALRDDPGGLTTWAIVLVLASALIVAGLLLGRRPVRVVLLAVAGVHTYLTVGFVEAVRAVPDAGPWGWVWFGAFAIRLVGQAVGFRRSPSTFSSPADPSR